MPPSSIIHQRHGAKTTEQKWLAIGLFSLLAIAYFGFYLVGIFTPDLLMQPVFNAVPLSFLLGAGIIVMSVIITFIYAFFANRIDQEKGPQT